MKGGFSKGANRFCTSMYHVMRALKNSGHPAASARQAVFIGDNYSENKNNINLAFASEMVANGWYDTIQFLYGPVGHTHNGIDRKHKDHNQTVGQFASPTLAVYFFFYLSVFNSSFCLAIFSILFLVYFFVHVCIVGMDLQLQPSVATTW